MIAKKREEPYNGYFMKLYNVDSVSELTDALVYSDIAFESVYATDIGDCGMKYFGGEYEPDEFRELYPKIKLDIDTVSFRLGKSIGSIEIGHADNSVILLVKDRNMELTDLIGQDV